MHIETMKIMGICLDIHLIKSSFDDQQKKEINNNKKGRKPLFCYRPIFHAEAEILIRNNETLCSLCDG